MTGTARQLMRCQDQPLHNTFNYDSDINSSSNNEFNCDCTRLLLPSTTRTEPLAAATTLPSLISSQLCAIPTCQATVSLEMYVLDNTQSMQQSQPHQTLVTLMNNLAKSLENNLTFLAL